MWRRLHEPCTGKTATLGSVPLPHRRGHLTSIWPPTQHKNLLLQNPQTHSLCQNSQMYCWNWAWFQTRGCCHRGQTSANNSGRSAQAEGGGWGRGEGRGRVGAWGRRVAAVLGLGEGGWVQRWGWRRRAAGEGGLGEEGRGGWGPGGEGWGPGGEGPGRVGAAPRPRGGEPGPGGGGWGSWASSARAQGCAGAAAEAPGSGKGVRRREG